LINAAMQAERQKYLGIGPYEQSDNRQGYTNNFKPKTVQTADLNNWQLVDQIYREVKWAQCPV